MSAGTPGGVIPHGMPAEVSNDLPPENLCFSGPVLGATTGGLTPRRSPVRRFYFATSSSSCRAKR